MSAPIFLFTDFGWTGPYVGQVHGAILSQDPDARIVDLIHDAPSMNPRHAAYLLAATLTGLPRDAIVIAVVDPGVGGAREALMVEADGRKLIGPDNGLLEIAMRRSQTLKRHVLQWQPEKLSASFHGRDLFAPTAARWRKGFMPASTPASPFPESRAGADWPDDLNEILYIDTYGNAMTGLRVAALPDPVRLTLGDETCPPRARTFSDVPHNFGFWYENSLGLAEIAVNGASAAQRYNLHIGDRVSV